ncbi:MAG: hypothetical protein C0600_13815, partial [Ignavibacteria bacterium]
MAYLRTGYAIVIYSGVCCHCRARIVHFCNTYPCYAMSICLFEDFSISTLLPLTHVNPDFDLRSGIFTLRERIGRCFPDDALQLYTRLGLVEVMRERSGLPVNEELDADLFISGSTILLPELVEAIRDNRGENAVFAHEGVFLAACVRDTAVREKLYHWLKTSLLREELVHGPNHDIDLMSFGVPIVEVETRAFRFPWDLLSNNTALLEADAAFYRLGTVESEASIASSAELVHSERMYVAAEVCIGAGAILDATDG